MKNKIYYKRNLPHIQPKGELFFVTWTVKNAIPAKKRLILQNEYLKKTEKITDKKKLDIENKIYFKKYDDLLHNEKKGNHYLKNERLSKIVADAIHFWDEKRIELISYCIMSNHVHLILKMFNVDENGKELYLRTVLESMKKYSAKQCNLIINNTGNKFWHYESFDRQIRDRDELHRIISYTLDNPLKAGLCKNREDWKFSYINEKYNEFM